jgi:hypothetical protein
MERLIGEPFQATDFIKVQHATSQAPDLNPPHEYPTCWGVMF